MKSVIQGIERLTERMYLLVSWLTLFAVLFEGGVVIMRYYVEGGLIVLQESVLYMHVAYLAFGVALTHQYEQHVRVDFLYTKFSGATRCVMDLLANLLIVGPVGVAILFYSFGYVEASWSSWEGSQEAGGLPGLFLLKTLILVMAVLIIFHAFLQGLKAVSQLIELRRADRP